MSIHTLHPRPHLSPREAGLGLAGAGLVVAAAFGAHVWVAEDGLPTAPGQQPASTVDPEGAPG